MPGARELLSRPVDVFYPQRHAALLPVVALPPQPEVNAPGLDQLIDHMRHEVARLIQLRAQLRVINTCGFSPDFDSDSPDARSRELLRHYHELFGYPRNPLRCLHADFGFSHPEPVPLTQSWLNAQVKKPRFARRPPQAQSLSGAQAKELKFARLPRPPRLKKRQQWRGSKAQPHRKDTPHVQRPAKRR